METNTEHLLVYKYLDVDENRIGVSGVKEFSKANWHSIIGNIYLCKD